MANDGAQRFWRRVKKEKQRPFKPHYAGNAREANADEKTAVAAGGAPAIMTKQTDRETLMSKSINRYTPINNPPEAFSGEVLQVTDTHVSVKIKRGKLGGLYKRRERFDFAKTEAVGFEGAKAGQIFAVRVTGSGESRRIRGISATRPAGEAGDAVAEAVTAAEAPDLAETDTTSTPDEATAAAEPAEPAAKPETAGDEVASANSGVGVILDDIPDDAEAAVQFPEGTDATMPAVSPPAAPPALPEIPTTAETGPAVDVPGLDEADADLWAVFRLIPEEEQQLVVLSEPSAPPDTFVDFDEERQKMLNALNDPARLVGTAGNLRRRNSCRVILTG